MEHETKIRALPAGGLALGAALLLGCCLVWAIRSADASEPETTGSRTSSLYMDVHLLGPGSVTAEAVAEAHQKDLAVQADYGVSFERYWVDEEAGRVYCLAKAPGPDAIAEAHREAHGLLPDRVHAVRDGLEARAEGDRKLFLDIHQLGPGNVTAEAVAEAHEKDLEVQGSHGVNFLQYWVDEATGTVLCLSEANDPAAVSTTHAEAHGLVPQEILEVIQGE